MSNHGEDEDPTPPACPEARRSSGHIALAETARELADKFTGISYSLGRGHDATLCRRSADECLALAKRFDTWPALPAHELAEEREELPGRLQLLATRLGNLARQHNIPLRGLKP